LDSELLFICIFFPPAPASPNSYLSSSFNAIRQHHPFNVTSNISRTGCLILRPKRLACHLYPHPIHVFAMSAFVDKLLLSCCTSACHHHQRCSIAVNFNASLHRLQLSYVYSCLEGPLNIRCLTTLLPRTHLLEISSSPNHRHQLLGVTSKSCS